MTGARLPPKGNTSRAFARLVEEHYAVLKRIAARAIRDRAYPEQMSPTSLVAESVLRIMRQRQKPRSEDYLRGLATVFMTRVLADQARARQAQRRGGGKGTKSLDDPAVELDLSLRARDPSKHSPVRSLVETQELLCALEELAHHMPRQMEVLTLHFLADISLPRVAELMGLSERTAYRSLEEGRKALAEHLKKKWG